MVEARIESSTPVSRARVGLWVVAMALVFGALLFVPAGRLDWTLGWIYIGLVVSFVVVNWACLRRWNPDLIERRMRVGEGTKRWDKVWGALFAPVMAAVYVVSGLEARDGASTLPAAAWPFGVIIFVLGSAMLIWPMTINPFFEKTVRIQTDRGHRVIDTGPYAYVRHPGYVGFSGWVLSTPLLLASAWAFLPAVLAMAGIVIRTALEDRMLRTELAGYPEYATRVRYRLIPGVW
ncbi:MAG: methyltransferase family protein [Planctomycetota bacterium]|jgi:protein-S-isoprenylcysteine O-methyltransferase Ste14